MEVTKLKHVFYIFIEFYVSLVARKYFNKLHATFHREFYNNVRKKERQIYIHTLFKFNEEFFSQADGVGRINYGLSVVVSL
jgi:hypothetical protein